MAKNFPLKWDALRQISRVSWVDWSCPYHPVIHIFSNIVKKCHEEVNLCFSAANKMFNIWTRKWGNIAKAIIKAYINTTINISSATKLTSFYLLHSTARVMLTLTRRNIANTIQHLSKSTWVGQSHPAEQQRSTKMRMGGSWRIPTSTGHQVAHATASQVFRWKVNFWNSLLF